MADTSGAGEEEGRGEEDRRDDLGERGVGGAGGETSVHLSPGEGEAGREGGEETEGGAVRPYPPVEAAQADARLFMMTHEKEFDAVS